MSHVPASPAPDPGSVLSAELLGKAVALGIAAAKAAPPAAATAVSAAASAAAVIVLMQQQVARTPRQRDRDQGDRSVPYD